MNEVILTGHSEKTFVKLLDKHGKPWCYLCKRAEKDKSICCVDGVKAVPIEINLIKLKVNNVNFVFPLCQECIFLFKGLLNQKEDRAEKSVKAKVSLN